jgi:hypothetical protein
MDGKDIFKLSDYAKRRLFQKFGTEAIYDRYKDYECEFIEYYNKKTVYQVCFYDRRNDYSCHRFSKCYLDKEIVDKMVVEMKAYNSEINAIHSEMFDEIISYDNIVNPQNYNFKDYCSAEVKMCEKYGISVSDFDWRVASGHIDEHHLGYFDISVFERNKHNEDVEEESLTEEAYDEYRDDAEKPFRGAFKSWEDYYIWREGRSFFR